MKNLKLTLAALASLTAFSLAPASAQIIITEVDPSGSGNANGYVQDWFELTNYGSSAVSLTGWKMDDNSNSFSSAVAMGGVSSIAAGQSVVFIESPDTNLSNIATLESNFKTSWFGSNVPSNFTIGYYSGSGVGLSQTADAVNVFNSSGVLQAGVSFGVAAAKASFDNSVAKITNTGSTDGVISTVSVAGVNGAFTSPSSVGEIGSPGIVPAAVPEPSSGALALVVGLVFAAGAWVRKNLARA